MLGQGGQVSGGSRWDSRKKAIVREHGTG